MNSQGRRRHLKPPEKSRSPPNIREPEPGGKPPAIKKKVGGKKEKKTEGEGENSRHPLGGKEQEKSIWKEDGYWRLSRGAMKAVEIRGFKEKQEPRTLSKIPKFRR